VYLIRRGFDMLKFVFEIYSTSDVSIFQPSSHFYYFFSEIRKSLFNNPFIISLSSQNSGNRNLENESSVPVLNLQNPDVNIISNWEDSLKSNIASFFNDSSSSDLHCNYDVIKYLLV
jgi:hypothetical protein